jgi:uncharacterized damage-inducible protein DinB
MPNSAESVFLDYSVRKLGQLTERIETCLGKLDERQLWIRGTDNENAVGNLALHLCGNVRQWIVAGIGGQPDVRQRDAEFSARGGVGSAELKSRLRQTVDEALAVLNAATPDRLLQTVTIQNYSMPVLEAIYHVVEHFSMHTGQIIFATKLLTGQDLGFYAHLNSAAAHGKTTP